MRISLEPAFVLHQRHFRETSLLLDIFSEQSGRVSLIAKGVRRNRSRTKPLLQPFVPLLVSFQGKNELMTLSSVEAASSPLFLSGKSLLAGFYLNELLVRVLQKQDPHPALYTIYHQTLIELSNASFELEGEKILRIFEKKLLAELGFGLQLEYDLNNEKICSSGFYEFCVGEGFKKAPSPQESLHLTKGDGQESPPLKKGGRGDFPTFKGETLLTFHSEQLDNLDLLREIKYLMRSALAPLLGSKPLESRRLFQHE